MLKIEDKNEMEDLEYILPVIKFKEKAVSKKEIGDNLKREKMF